MIFDIPPIDALTLWSWIGGVAAWLGGVIVYPVVWLRAKFKTIDEKFLTVEDFEDHVDRHDKLHADGTDAIRRDLARLEQGQSLIMSELLKRKD